MPDKIRQKWTEDYWAADYWAADYWAADDIRL